jgi:hypothetical protein
VKIPSIIAPVMKSRRGAIVIAAFPVIFMLLNISDLFVWKCPFYEYLNIQCFGCGMTRAVEALGKGEFAEAFHLHPFSYLLITGWITWIIILFLPEKQHETVINKLEIIENKTGLIFILFIIFIFFGLVRLIFQI